MSTTNFTLNDLKYFLYTCTINEDFNPIKSNARQIVDYLIRNNKGNEVIKEIIDYSLLNSSISSTNIDASSYILAAAVALRYNEQITNAAYNALKEISETPLHIFAFIYYHKCILEEIKKEKLMSGALTEEEAKRIYGKGWGKGQRKAVIKWYNDHTEEDILRLVTKYRHSHSWTHKDVIKIAHIKAASSGIALIFKYLMFGFEKIKNEKTSESEKSVFEFISDYEKLKHAQTGAEAAALIRKHKFHLEHLPTKVQKNKEIWEALVEDMSIQQLCNYIGVLTSKGLLSKDTNSYKHILENILSKEKISLSKNLHPIQVCLALQVYLKVNQLTEIVIDQSDLLNKALFNVFQSCANTQKSSPNKRIMCVVEMNSFMLHSPTENFRLLNSIDTASTILLTLQHTEKNCDFCLINDKFNEISLPMKEENLNLNTVDSILKKFSPSDKNENNVVFEWCLQNNKLYDCFIFLLASPHSENRLLDSIGTYRSKANLAHSKLVLVNLAGKVPSSHTSNLHLNFKGWNMDSYLVLESYLNDKF